MVRNYLTLSRLLAAGTASVYVLGACADEPIAQSQFMKDALVTPDIARATTRAAFPGKNVAEELEKEEGGSGLRYSFDVKANDVTHEVGVDAKTGALLENSVEGPHAD